MTLLHLGARALLLAGFALPALGHEAHVDRRGAELFKPGAAHAALAPGLPADGLPVLEPSPTGGMAITTASAEAQAYFDQGLRLIWGFNHAEAARAFRAARSFDPACAMCAWGEALALGPNINDAMAPAAVPVAWAAISEARKLSATATPKERTLIAALASRYSDDPATERQPLDLAWADATRVLAARFPQDVEIQILHADALMNLQPWDYWEADKATPKGDTAEIVATLERALALNPDHPAALHLYIHAVEASATPERAEAVADRLARVPHATGHLAHMPAHIYARVGRHRDSMAQNRKAIAADEAFLAQAGDAASRLYRYGYYPHNLHFLMVAAQMSGSGPDALAAAEKLVEITNDGLSQDYAWVQAIRTGPWGAQALFSDPATILALPAPAAEFPFVAGYRHFARGLALVRDGDPAAAGIEADAVAALRETADFSGLEEQYLPARDVLGIAENVVRARIAEAEGDTAAAVALLEAAAAAEEALPYMEPPYWHYPVRQTLGAVLLRRGHAVEAEAAFSAALAATPRNGWAVFGLAEALRAQGKDASRAEAELDAVWLGDRTLLTLDRL